MEIVKYPDKMLRLVSEKIDKVDGEIRSLAREMIRVMRKYNGLGLAAIQIGVPKRLIVVNADLIKRGSGIIVLANPKVVEGSGESFEEEGCLSIPGFYEKVKRYDEVLVEGLNYDGMIVRLRSDGYIARAFQHEIDHINGILFIDRLPFFKKLKFSFKYALGKIK